MKRLLSWGIRTARRLFYNTPIKHWRVTEWIYAAVGRRLIGNDPFPVLQLDGMKLKANGQDVIVTAALVNGNYEPFTLLIFRRLLIEALEKSGEEPCVFVDVGANIGLFTVTAALLHSKLQVFAFEPNATSYRLLEENLELNRLTNVNAQRSAVGEKRGTASLDITSLQAGMHSIYGRGARRMEIPVVSLDDFLLERRLLPSLIKVDVEGYEPRVLEGMKSFPDNHQFQMILEFNPEHLKRGEKDPADFLEDLLSRFDSVHCLDEIEGRVIPYIRSDVVVRERILGVGYNLLLVRGTLPECLR